MKLIYPAIFTPFDDSDGFTVEVPDLPGCVTEGDSLVEAIEMGTDAASGWILDEIEEGNSFPAARAPYVLDVPEGIKVWNENLIGNFLQFTITHKHINMKISHFL